MDGQRVTRSDPKIPIGTAIGYMIKRWDKFAKYVDHGHVEIDNNIIENAIRPLALGRKTISLPAIMMQPSILDIIILSLELAKQ